MPKIESVIEKTLFWSHNGIFYNHQNNECQQKSLCNINWKKSVCPNLRAVQYSHDKVKITKTLGIYTDLMRPHTTESGEIWDKI